MKRTKDKPVQLDQRLDKLALRLRDKLFGMLEHNVETFIERMDEMVAHRDLKPANVIQDAPAPRTLPPATPKQPALGNGKGKGSRGTYLCKRCRQAGHRANNCPNEVVAADADEDPGGAIGRPVKTSKVAAVTANKITPLPRSVPKRLAWDETKRLIAQAQAGDRRALDWLVRTNIGLVHHQARKSPRHALPYEDVVQEGAIGLMKAIMRFDESRGLKLSTFAGWWIKHHIHRSHEDLGSEIRLPARLGMMVVKINRAQTDLGEELGRKPTYLEIASRSEVPIKDVKRLLNRGYVGASLDAGFGEGGESSLHDFLSDGAPSALDELQAAETKAAVAAALAELPPRHAEILRLRYEEEMTLKEAGERTSTMNGGRNGVSRELIRQIESKSLRMLKARLGGKNLPS